jgi:hypothetical protein
MLEWLGTEGEQLRIAFTKVFGSRYEAFGSPALHVGGLSDGTKGVQWHAGLDPRDGVRFAGVNLEGMQYNDWPVAQLIESELRRPSLASMIAKDSSLGDVVVLWRRDYWQKQSRPPIEEQYIAPTPSKLVDLTGEGWNEALKTAGECLDRARRRRGRATQTVTLLSGEQVTGQVSPHLTFHLTSACDGPWEDFLRAVKLRMKPLHSWATQLASKPVAF